ncbi:hypothetical protein LTR62_002390 [Meristemomyces frigidus]|uniref:DNA repair protein REV1 n=1 Tax=Meristemomyces frigidus TaxID=1508187 RepID=A0AAN7TFP3_9PEZI|nr:hypothetical protein LTR62_002390 [Meristemomyces frigidus]
MGSRLEQKSTLVRKRIEDHTFDGEDGDEYEGSKFGGFTEYFRRKKIKLQNLDAQLRTQSTDKPKIFKGLVCHINGYTQPSLNDLHTMIVQHGGGFLQYLDGKTMVTHIIASNLTPKKKEEFKRYRIVKPAWVTESVKAGKLLPWENYRVVDEGVNQKVLGFANGSMTSQLNRNTHRYKEQTDASWYTSQLKAENAKLSASSTERKKVSFAQTITPDEEIEDSKYPLPEITSSIERALAEDGLSDEEPMLDPIQKSGNLLAVRAELKTPPPSSPPPAQDRSNVEAQLSNVPADAAQHEFTLRPRQGSQEPDYSMAVVRDSEALRSISPTRLANMTAEEHNALLLSDPKIRKSTVVNPNFLEQYYGNSRLHHLSTWKADLKSQLQAIAVEQSSSQKQKYKRLPGQRRYIMHVDFDSFFAAVSLQNCPQHKDKPCVVAHGNGSGSEIASCNYPAREFGVKNGMWMKRAQELCPDIKILPYDFPAYEAASREFYTAIMATDGIVQSVSIDEALVDISASCFTKAGTDGVKRHEGGVFREQSKADEIAQVIRDEVLEKTGCNVSVGIGGNILLAKLALRKAKPAGQYQLRPEDVLDFIGPLEVEKLPGVAWSISSKLEDIGIKLVKDIREQTKERLINTLGPKTGEKLWEYSRGIDRVEVGEQIVRKSVSAEVNWGVRFETVEQVDEFMQGLSGELSKRLLKEGVKGKQLTLKVMRRAADAPRDPPKHLGHGKCDTYNKSLQLGVATNEAALITKESIAIMRSFGITPGELRGIGLQMLKLEPVRASAEGADLGSQRKLHFKAGQSTRAAIQEIETAKVASDPIQDDAKTPEKQRIIDFAKPSVPVRPVNLGTPTKKLMNTLGTQFVLPTQFDPAVLAELPVDIQSKLARHLKANEPDSVVDMTKDDSETARAPTKAELQAIALPNQSQLDPSILEALPDDVRNEILGFYRSPGNRKRGEQALLPQSPRKNRTLPITKQPVKRKRGGGLFAGHARSNMHNSDASTLTQANFVSRPHVKPLVEDAGATTEDNTDGEPDEVDPEFLAALPEDMKQEVLAQQRNARLARTGGIDLSLHQRPRARQQRKKGQDAEVLAERILQLPPHPVRPTFTVRKLSELSDLRSAVRAWYEEFLDEGPYEEDIQALEIYLKDVVLEERDLNKATAVVKYMGWLLAEHQQDEVVVRQAWEAALRDIRAGLQAAVKERALGSVELN